MPSDRTPPSYSRGQRRLLTALAGLVVAALAAGAYVLTYDALRELALAGTVSRRWAPLYPAMADTLVAMTILSLVVARGARWWTRLLRWALLLVLAAGGAAASVQHSVWGYDSLPEDAVRAGVAVAPHVMLVIAIWLWLTMFKQIRVARPAAEEPAPVETQRGHVKVLEPAAPPLALEAPAGTEPAFEPASEPADEEPLIPFLPEPHTEHAPDSPAHRPAEPEPEPALDALFRPEPSHPEPVHPEDASDAHEIATHMPEEPADDEEPQHAEDEPAEPEHTGPGRAHSEHTGPEHAEPEQAGSGHAGSGHAASGHAGFEPFGYGGGLSSEPAPPLDALPEPRPPLDQAPLDQAPYERIPLDQAPPEQAPLSRAPLDQAPPEQAASEQAPVDRAPALLPTDVELVRGRDRDRREAEQRPVASTTRPDIVIPGADEDLHDTPPADRAEDPDAGDPPAKDWNPPPSSSFRSGPTPPAD